MAAECARDALLKRVIDNKENAGILLLRWHSLFFFVIFLMLSWSNVFLTVLCFCVNAEKFRSDLMKIAMTTLCSKILSQDKEHFAEMAVDAVFRLKVPSYSFYGISYVNS